MENKREILTTDILEQCEDHESEARLEIHSRFLEWDLSFDLSERVFFWFSDSEEFEEPDLDDICKVVSEQYLSEYYK